MRYFNDRKVFILIILVMFFGTLNAEDRRTIPMDMYIIVDGSSSFQAVKSEAVAWVNQQIVDRILLEGDKITIWSAGDSAQIVYSAELSSPSGKNEIKNFLMNLVTEGRTSDFSGALRDLEPRLSAAQQNRLTYTVLITASAGGLESVITGNASAMLRWFRSEKFQRWQAYVLAPDISRNVSQAASDYMNSQR